MAKVREVFISGEDLRDFILTIASVIEEQEDIDFTEVTISDLEIFLDKHQSFIFGLKITDYSAEVE